MARAEGFELPPEHRGPPTPPRLATRRTSMSEHAKIEWCDSTVNPTTGCDGCELWRPGVGGPCYAGHIHQTIMARRRPHEYAASFTEVRLVPGRMAKAAAASDL